MSRVAPVVRPAVIAAATAVMLARTWQTWPDPLVDYGTQLYTAWQVSLGRVLYRDVAFYGGPLSTYVNAGLFRLFGVGLHTLEIANGVVLLLTMSLAYRLTRRASGPSAAVAGVVVFALVFAFGQGVGVGNYNWITPYTHELTHGLLLAAVAIACLDRFGRTGRLRWAAAAGGAVGLTLLTRIEPAAACVLAVAAQWAGLTWASRAGPRRAAVTAAAVLVPATAVVVIATLAFTAALPTGDAVRSVLGAWRWAFDRRISGLPFYRRVVGLDDVRGGLLGIAEWTAGYAAVAAAAVGAGLAARRSRGAVVVAGVVASVLMAVSFDRLNWPAALVPLPVCLALAGAVAVAAVARRQDRAPLRLALVVFAGVLVSKMLLQAHAFQYGFALALPGTLVLVAIAAEELPAWVDRRGGSGAVVRAVLLPVGVAFVAFTWVVQGRLLAGERYAVAAGGPDAFRASAGGLEVAAVVAWVDRHVPPEGTVAVVPQGLMVNYLARRATPTRYVNLMPPEVIAAGEPAVIAALTAHPPAAVVVETSAIRDGQFDMDRQYGWGRSTVAWVGSRYRTAEQVTLPPPLATLHHFVILVPR